MFVRNGRPANCTGCPVDFLLVALLEKGEHPPSAKTEWQGDMQRVFVFALLFECPLRSSDPRHYRLDQVHNHWPELVF